MRRATACVLVCCLAAATTPAQGGALFERVVEVLGDGFHDRAFRRHELPELADALRPKAKATTTAAAEREVVHALLADVPASHLALYSRATYQRLTDELARKANPTLGFVLTALHGEYYVDGVLDGGPAERAGLRRGDRVLAIDGTLPAASPRLDWRADDAWLPDLPQHALLVAAGDVLTLRVARGDASPRDVAVAATKWSGYQASVASQRRLILDGHTFGYVHLWLVFHTRAAELVGSAAKRFADTEGLVIDLRGRGGSATEVERILDVLAELHDDGVRMVFLIDEGTRSAKEVLAHEIRSRGLGTLVGERTAGAVLPASFEAVGDDAVLMLPRTRLGRHSQAIEGIGVKPDVLAADRLVGADGGDAIRDAAVGWLVEHAPDR